MAKKSKDTTATTKKEPKPKAPVDPVKTKNLVRLLNILALLIAITAFLLQLFAVLSHHWKWQKTDLRPIITSSYPYVAPSVLDDSRLDQHYGLFSRDVKLYSNNDEKVAVRTSTRFPRLDDEDDAALNLCLSRTSTLRGVFLTCSNQVVSLDQCHCRRHVYWRVVIVFEILALVLLGLVVFLAALLTTQFQALLKLAGAGLSLLAFILLLIGLILILSHLKRETLQLADSYPHIYQRLAHELGVVYDPYRTAQYNPSVLRQAVRRQAHDVYRMYPIQGRTRINETHYREYSPEAGTYVDRPIQFDAQPVPYVSSAPRSRTTPTTTRRRTETTTTTPHSDYGPALGYSNAFEHTRAGIGWSTILSILAMLLALLVPLILIFSWLKSKQLGPDVKTVTTTVTTEYVPVPQQDIVETVPLRTIPGDYDPRRPIGEAIVTTQNIRQGPYDTYGSSSNPVIVRDVVIRDEQPLQRTTQDHSFPVHIESRQTTHRT